MRLPLIAPADLSPEQRPIYEDMRAGIEKSFRIQVHRRQWRADRALNPWLHEPKFGKPIWELTKALSASASLPKPVREVAILVTGAKFRSAYEIYAHVMIAEQRGFATTSSPPSWPVSAPRPHARGGNRLRCRLHAGRSWRAAGAELRLAVQTFGQRGTRNSSIWSEALLPCVHHTKWVRRAGTRAEHGLISFRPTDSNFI